ncbi:hypothetical protein [Nocardia jiangxiensis]|uniref:hypothetical protein n=1 Tax=Nocardia jiangxiensis TaxID=282685 RepID=UPI00031C5DF6|nr:hypothetical protein [Nocardia jiangxiensis]
MLAHIHEKLQDLLYLTGGAWSGEGENPVPPRYRVPRPNEIFAPDEDEGISEDIGELDAQFGG